MQQQAPGQRFIGRCSYEDCKVPDQSSKFFLIDGSSKAGGRNWSSLAGRVLCNA